MFIKKQRMIELQNVNLRLRAGGNVKKRNWYLILGMLLLVQLIAIFYFGSKKAGFHYDEYYSYYSSNVSIGLVPTDREWKPGSEIADEFRVLPGQRFPPPVVRGDARIRLPEQGTGRTVDPLACHPGNGHR